jgi:NTE family protein
MTTAGNIEATLRTLPLFGELSDDLLQLVSAEVQSRVVPAGAAIFRLGEAGDELFIVLQGGVQIYLPSANSGDEVVAELTAGRWFGEMALITGEPRSASARATVDTTLLVMSRASFQTLLARVPALALTLSHELSRRLRAHLLHQPSGTALNLLVLEDADPTSASAAVARRVVAAIASELGQTVGFLDLMSQASPEQVGVLAEHGVVYLASPATADNLDGVLRAYPSVVVRVGRTHALADALRAAPGARVSADLLRDAQAVVDRPVAGPVLTSPLQRLVRRFLHRRVGLVLGAGGAKGMAHIGALHCFEAAGLRFDMLAGTSVGGCVAGLAALGWESRRILDLCQNLRRNFRRLLLDFGVPSGSLLRGRKKRTLLQREMGRGDITELPVPFWTVAADLVTGSEAVLSSGPLWQALDATTAIPTIFPPVAVGERILIDGWVINPFPADVLRREGADVVIGIEPCAANGSVAQRARRSKRRRSWSRFFDPRRLIDPAGIVRVAMRAIDVGAREHILDNLTLANVCIQPALGAYSTTDLTKLAEIVAAGEAAAEQALPAILRSTHHARGSALR